MISYTYDSAGRRASMILPGNRTLTYVYNARGLLASLTDWQGRVTSFVYDSDGNRTKIIRPNGVESTYDYDSAGHITSITHTKGASTLLSFAYTYDDAGRRTSVTTAEGTENYSYDALGRLTQVSYPGGPTVSYTYDAAGNRKTETRDGDTTYYDYDAAGQLVTVGNKTYTYDANGNLTQAGSDSFIWDYDSRLTQATVGTHTASYSYDGDGVRVGATVDGSAMSYLVDTQGGLPTVVDDGSKAYVHADGVLAEVSASGATQLLGDALGSVRGVADANGTLVGSRSYEAFGMPRTTSGTTGLFGFTGEPTDATGLVYLRARYLDTALGGFLSADSLFPNGPGTQGYNLYSYAGNNPTTWTDPTGHLGLGIAEVLKGMALIVIALLALVSGLCVTVLTCLPTEEGQTEWPPEDLGEAPGEFPPTPSVEQEGETQAELERRPVVIGENSVLRPDRVQDAAVKIGAEWYKPERKTPIRKEQIFLNQIWIIEVMADRRIIYDLGIAPEKTDRSVFYAAEKSLVVGYPRLYPYPFAEMY